MFLGMVLLGARTSFAAGLVLSGARGTHLDHGVYERLPDVVQHLLHILHVCTVSFAFRHCHVHTLQQLWHCLHCCLPYLFMEVELQQRDHDLCDLCAQMFVGPNASENILKRFGNCPFRLMLGGPSRDARIEQETSSMWGAACQTCSDSVQHQLYEVQELT